MNKYRSNFWVVFGAGLTLYNLYKGFYMAQYGAGDFKIATAALLTAMSLAVTLWEYRKPRAK